MRVALYARVSTTEQAIHGLSVEAQLHSLDEWAKEYTVVDHYVDLGVSARSPATKRPELQRLLRDVEQDRVDLIAFTKLDRFTRNIKEYYKCEDVLEKHHVAWKAIHEDYETLTASTLVRIEPYEGSNGYTKVVVSLDGVKCDWITKQLPPRETVTIGGRTVTDDTKQMELIISFVDKVKERIRK